MSVPTNGWNNGAWNKKATQFRLLAEMLGLNKPSISPDELQVIFHKVASAKVFAESVQSFLEESGMPRKAVVERLEDMEKKLGLMEPLPFMSMKGISDPGSFSGVAILPAGITNWSVLRHEQILLAHKAGALFERVIVTWSSRKCGSPADRRHPYIGDRYEEGDEPTERKLMLDIIDRDGGNLKYEIATLPNANVDARPLSLEQQLKYIMSSGEFGDLSQKRVYVPSTPNSLYVPLHVRRVVGLQDVWFSQGGARLVREMPDYWWPSLQDVMTTPNGIIRLWVELLHAGCMTV